MTSHTQQPQQRGRICQVLLLAACVLTLGTGLADKDDEFLEFDDTLLEEELVYPDWFKISLGDLNEDIKEAKAVGKSGILVYFGQKLCAYCEQFLQENIGAPDIERYIREHYDIIPIDIWGIEDIVDTNGETYTERDLSLRYKTNFTPSLVFYDLDGKPVFRLRGYYPPYKFRAALNYVTEGFYKEETFKEYLDRAEPGVFFRLAGLNERDFFAEPPYDLDRSNKPGNNHLAVFFEQGDCHACDLLHTGPLNEATTLDEIFKMDSVQLNIWSDTPVITPQGEKTTAREWARDLNLFYTPTIIFYDFNGDEIIRIDSVVQYYRLLGVLEYINQKAYQTDTDYQGWRLKQRRISDSET
jgi:thioredoxin-related protein